MLKSSSWVVQQTTLCWCSWPASCVPHLSDIAMLTYIQKNWSLRGNAPGFQTTAPNKGGKGDGRKMESSAYDRENRRILWINWESCSVHLLQQLQRKISSSLVAKCSTTYIHDMQYTIFELPCLSHNSLICHIIQWKCSWYSNKNPSLIPHIIIVYHFLCGKRTCCIHLSKRNRFQTIYKCLTDILQ